jgi:hypothetical protein
VDVVTEKPAPTTDELMLAFGFVPDELELEETGQLAIGIEGEQRALEGMAPAGTPAPITFERDAGAEEELERRTTAAEDDRRARGVVLFNGEEITRAAYDRIRGVTPSEERGGAHANTPDRAETLEPITDETLELLEHAGVQPERIAAMKNTRSSSTPKKYPCAICGHLAPAEELCYSQHTRQRYCPLVDVEACTRRAQRAGRKET